MVIKKITHKFNLLANETVRAEFINQVQKIAEIVLPMIPSTVAPKAVDLELNPNITATKVGNMHRSIIRLASAKSQLKYDGKVIRNVDIHLGHETLLVENQFSMALVRGIVQGIVETSNPKFEWFDETNGRIKARTAELLRDHFGIECEKNEKSQFSKDFKLNVKGEKLLKQVLPIGKKLATKYETIHADKSTSVGVGGGNGRGSMYVKLYCSVADTCEANTKGKELKTHKDSSYTVNCSVHQKALVRNSKLIKQEKPKS